MYKFKVEYINGNRAWSLCPFHDDKVRPNLSISLDKEYYGRFKCWACGKEGNLTDKQMNELNLSKKKKRLKPIPINWERLTQKYVEDNNECYGKLQRLWNVWRTSLIQFRCGFDGEAYTFPMYNMAGSGLCTTGMQRVWLDGRKKAVHNSQLGLFMPECLDGNTIFIVEGISDAVAVYDLGFDVIGKPCATYGDKIIKHFLLESDIHSVIIIPDKGVAGIKSANNILKALMGIVSCNMFEFDGKDDIRKYISQVGKEQASKELGDYIL